MATLPIDRRGSGRISGTWPVVLGTLMVALASFDAAWGLATVALGEQLQLIAGDLQDNSLGMTLGRIVNFVTFGVLTVSGVETGEHAAALLKMLPRPNYLVEVGWVRVGMSIAAATFGVLLARRIRWSLWPVAVWAVVSLVWTVWSTLHTWSFTVDSLGDPTQGESLPMFSAELAVHFIWPLLLLWRCGLTLLRTGGQRPSVAA
ncbi:MAG: hypothetical protein QF733_05755 [Phycisphaerales bacterium]|jgi:hypothetical protein|nr:hypothetical protein [Phycisphaerales bacterium]